ncbi:hypothetical protein CXG81DRAFT_25801 [Caulochytrium protostelioides]|uniref:Uncharacterized protein n=1 Tax=Caulochytrium protostelioides TaxID=1555241 RepID=A0A4P9X8B5_9FUNG|nr:hypothetical protein CXG81DRAFT_25801 [Caulochytrium protostelioides]|eukprot:RKP01527.1 hypothetical protein CXG81DRAFT_25801 [Caulochytrium protostelioides]
MVSTCQRERDLSPGQRMANVAHKTVVGLLIGATGVLFLSNASAISHKMRKVRLMKEAEAKEAADKTATTAAGVGAGAAASSA